MSALIEPTSRERNASPSSSSSTDTSYDASPRREVPITSNVTSVNRIESTTSPVRSVITTPETSPVRGAEGSPILSSLTPQKVTFPPSSVAARLQAAGFYNPVSEHLPEIIGFRKTLHLAEGPELTQKTIQMYNNIRKLYGYLKEKNSLDPFHEPTLNMAFDNLLECGLKGDSLGIWIKGLRQFINYLRNRDYQTKQTQKIVIELCDHMSRRQEVTERIRVIKHRRQYNTISERSNIMQFRWMEELKDRLEDILQEDIVTVDQFHIVLCYMAGCILRLGHRPQVITNFTTAEYEQGRESNVYYVSEVKSL